MENLYQKFKKDSGQFDLLHLTWKNDFTEEQTQNHKHQLEQANACGKRAWILFQHDGAHARLVTFSELKIPSSLDLKEIVIFLNSKSVDQSKILKVFLRAVEYAVEPYYDITEYFLDCLDGDLKVAKALSGREIFLLQIEVNPNQRYDILTKKGTQKLIEAIYEPYFRQFSDYFEKTIAGIQIEPPKLLDYTEYSTLIPWTPEIPEFFSETKGYNLLEYIPLLFYETYDSATVRHDFWQTLTQLCSLRYVSTIRKWANNHGIKLAISQPLNSKSFSRNSVILSQNADLLCVHEPEGNSDLTDARRQILFRQTYSYPSAHLSICPFTPLPIYPFVPQSVSRMNLLISSSHRDSNILVIYPMSSFWVKSRREKVEWILQNLIRLDEMLKRWGYDYDYGDEDLIAKFGKINEKNKTLTLGQNSYSVVLIPPCISLQESTVRLLREFISVKGKLVALEPLPYLLKGKVGTEPYPLESLLYHRRTTILPEDSEKLESRLKKTVDKKLKSELKFYLRPNNSQTYVILQHRRKCNELDLYFLFNSSSEKKEILLEFDSEVSLEEWNLVDGTRSQPDQWYANRKTYAELNFNPKQMRILILLVAAEHEREDQERS